MVLNSFETNLIQFSSHQTRNYQGKSWELFTWRFLTLFLRMAVKTDQVSAWRLGSQHSRSANILGMFSGSRITKLDSSSNSAPTNWKKWNKFIQLIIITNNNDNKVIKVKLIIITKSYILYSGLDIIFWKPEQGFYCQVCSGGLEFELTTFSLWHKMSPNCWPFFLPIHY